MSRNVFALMMLLTCSVLTCSPAPAFGQGWYFGLNVGSLTQSFTSRQLEPGFQAAEINESHIAARVVLIGREFTPHLAAQLTYMRPVRFVSYRDVNGDSAGHSVWTGFGGATLKARAPIAGRTSLYGEAGLGISSRHGFDENGVVAVRDASHASVLLGGGVEYRIRPSWDLTAGATFIPGKSSDREAGGLMVDGGFRYTFRPAPDAGSQGFGPDSENDLFTHKRLLQFEYTTGFGYSINTFLSTKVPVFWKGDVQVDRGAAIHYDRTVFHTRSVFSIDIGASGSIWRTRADAHDFFTLSVYPLFRFTPIRTRSADAYFCYSLAGPTFISARTLDALDLGSQFTFQDFLGGGVALGAAKRFVVGVKINHYSNGNLFPENAGVMVPVTFTFGWAF